MADEQPKRRVPVKLSADHLSSDIGVALLDLLDRVVADGTLSNQEIADLSAWLGEAAQNSTIPGIHFLREEVAGILADGSVSDAERNLLQNAILRVMPITERDRAKARIADARSRQRETNRQRRLAEFADADRITDRQLEYICALGGTCSSNATKAEASTIITELLEHAPSARQRMVLRFWNRLDLMGAGVAGVTAWMDQWYAEDPNRLAAWTLWKQEAGDAGGRTAESVEHVPIGAGPQYLARVKVESAKAQAVAQPPSRDPRRWPFVVAVLVVMAFLSVGYLGYREREAKRLASGPTFHTQIATLPEAQRFAKLRYVITDTSFCDRVVRADFVAPNAGGAIWSVSCFDGNQYAVVIQADAHEKPVVMTCDQLARATTCTCWGR